MDMALETKSTCAAPSQAGLVRQQARTPETRHRAVMQPLLRMFYGLSYSGSVNVASTSPLTHAGPMAIEIEPKGATGVALQRAC